MFQEQARTSRGSNQIFFTVIKKSFSSYHWKNITRLIHVYNIFSQE